MESEYHKQGKKDKWHPENVSAAQGNEENERIVNFPNTESVSSIDRMTNPLENSQGYESRSGKKFTPACN